LHEEKDGFKMAPEHVEKLISPRTKMIILNTPGNPTGNVMTKSDVEVMGEIAKHHDLLVLTDEIYEKIVYDGTRHYSIASDPEMKDRSISVFGFSKTYAMTGWRIGYAVSSKRIVDEMNKNQEFYVTSTSSISQKAAIAALDGPQDAIREMVAQYKKRRDFTHSEMDKIEKIGCVKPKGAFYLFPNISKTGMTSEEVANILLDKGKVVTVPGTAFGFHGEGYLRLSTAASMESLKKGLDNISAVLDDL
jgi:aspartate/methionine/tyrosine aminotransferase